MRKTREHILGKLDIFDMAIKQLKREGKDDNWTSFDFLKKFVAIYDYIKKSNHKKLQAILTN